MDELTTALSRLQTHAATLEHRVDAIPRMRDRIVELLAQQDVLKQHVNECSQQLSQCLQREALLKEANAALRRELDMLRFTAPSFVAGVKGDAAKRPRGGGRKQSRSRSRPVKPRK